MSFQEFYNTNSYWINLLMGIAVSLILFSVTYRKSVGARKERTTQTYQDIVKILVRNLLNNHEVLTVAEINRIRQTKSIENRIKVTDLPDELSFLYALYTRIAEDEMLPSVTRKDLLTKINDYLEEIGKQAPEILEKEPSGRKEAFVKSYGFYLGILSTAIGLAIVLSLNFIFNVGIEYNVVELFITIAGLALALFSILAYVREEQGKAPMQIAIREEGLDFESRIYNIIKGLGDTKREFQITKENKAIRFDFLLTRGDKNFLIEAKWFRNYATFVSIVQLESVAKMVRDLRQNYVLILVVNDKKYLAYGLSDLQQIWDYVFDEKELKEFRNKLIHERN